MISDEVNKVFEKRVHSSKIGIQEQKEPKFSIFGSFQLILGYNCHQIITFFSDFLFSDKILDF